MNIGEEIRTKTITPARTRPARETERRAPKRDWTPAKPARPVKAPDKVPAKTPKR